MRVRLTSILALLVCSGTLRAQTLPLGEPSTASVYNPTVGLSGIGDASSAVKNPAMLSSLRSWSLVYLHTERPGNGVVGGRGDGVYFAMPVPLLSAFTTALTLESVRPPTTFPFSSTGKFSAALAWKPLPFAAIGLDYHITWRDQGKLPGIHHSLDLGLHGNLGRLFAAGLVIRDLATPVVGGVPQQRVYDLEVAYRPWGNARMEVALGVRIGERRRDADPHFRVWLSPAQGFRIKADVEWRRDVDLDGAAENDVRAALGLELDFCHFGVGGYGLFGRELGVNRGQGFSLVAHASGERSPPPWDGPVHLEKIVLDGETRGAQLVAVLRRLRHIERERTTVGVVVVVRDLAGGLGTAESLRAALVRLREKQKHVLAVLSTPTTKGYYVASVAQRIFLQPAGGIDMKGLHSTVLYFKGTGELLGVRADFVKIGEYKSASEQLTNDKASGPAREQREAFIDDLYRNVVEGIARGRNVESDKARRWIDAGPYTADEALAAGLVDELAAPSELPKAIDRALGRHVPLTATARAPEHATSFAPPRIAVLHVEGDMTEGESQTIPLINIKTAGMRTLLRAIERARTDSSVRGLVLYVDTPGGSAFASDTLADALRTFKDKKPLVCAFGDVAASGGYFIASACDKIFTPPSTLTGSIGIFTGKLDISGLGQKLGVTTEFYERGKHAGLESLWRPYTDEERALLLSKLRYYYDRFVGAVAEGRGLDRAVVDGLGRGRVWSGRAALSRRLADEYGGPMEAIEHLAADVGLRSNEYDVLWLPEEKSLLFQLLGWLGLDVKAGAKNGMAALDTALLGRILGALPASVWLAPTTPQARLDATITIE